MRRGGRGRDWTRFFTSPRLRGEVGSHRRCDPGEGALHVLSSIELAEAAPHPPRASEARLVPLPVRTGRGRTATPPLATAAAHAAPSPHPAAPPSPHRLPPSAAALRRCRSARCATASTWPVPGSVQRTAGGSV